MGRIVIAVDCSGSISNELLTVFASEINAIKEDLKPSGLDVVYFDSRVCKLESFNEDEPVKLTPAGGGGTAFSPVIEHVNAMSEPPAALVFLTDLYCDDFGDRPDYPVMWAVLEGSADKTQVPFGEVLEVSNDEES
jgi:predicted metal-dependent peptidase